MTLAVRHFAPFVCPGRSNWTRISLQADLSNHARDVIDTRRRSIESIYSFTMFDLSRLEHLFHESFFFPPRALFRIRIPASFFNNLECVILLSSYSHDRVSLSPRHLRELSFRRVRVPTFLPIRISYLVDSYIGSSLHFDYLFSGECVAFVRVWKLDL